jgi:hypothetical protein
VDGAAAGRLAVVVDDDMGLDAVVGHRQQPDAGLPPLAERPGHGGERVAGVEHLGADQVGREVAVAESEPGRLDAVRLELLLGPPGLVPPSPPAVGVDPAAEGVHDRVEVGAHLEPVEPQVVGGVGDHRHLGVAPGVGAAADVAEDPLEEARAADASAEDGDAP